MCAQAVGQAEQLTEPEAHLGSQKTDRANRAGNYGDNAAGIDNTAEPAAHYALTKHRVKQGSWLQRFALHVVGVGQNNG